MVEFVPIFETQYTMPLIISIAVVTDTVTSRLRIKNHTSKSFFISLLILVAVTFLQGGLFLSLKQNNLYQDLKISRSQQFSSHQEGHYETKQTNNTHREYIIKQYQMIIQNPERLKFYEKHHEITTDLHTLRSPSFQNENIIKALNFYLVTLMIAINSTNNKRAYHSRNYIISLIFSLYVLEAHMILSEDVEISKYQSLWLSNVTQKEMVLFVKTLILSLVMIIKHLTIYTVRPMHEKVEITLQQTEQEYVKYSKKTENTEVQVELIKIRELVNRINNGSEESSDGISSNKSLYRVLSIMTIFMLLTGNYEE